MDLLTKALIVLFLQFKVYIKFYCMHQRSQLVIGHVLYKCIHDLLRNSTMLNKDKFINRSMEMRIL